MSYYLLKEDGFKILLETGDGILLEPNSFSSTFSEGAIGTDIFAGVRALTLLLSEIAIGTDVMRSLLNGTNVIWTAMVKASAAVWTKFTKS